MPLDPNKAPDDEKLRELILFIASRSTDDERFGSVKLNKLLFFSDFLAFAELGTSITGHPYQKLPKGPAPKRLLPILEAMQEDRIFAISERDCWGHSRKVPIALRSANVKIFTAEEIALVTDVLENLYRKNAKGISTLSYRFPWWDHIADGEIIPYEAALLRRLKPRKKDTNTILGMGDEIAALRKDLLKANE